MKIINEMLKGIAVAIVFFLALWAMWELGNSAQECADLSEAGYTVERSLLDCKVLIHDSWMDSEEYFQAEYEKASKN